VERSSRLALLLAQGVSRNADAVRAVPVGTGIFEHGDQGREMYGVIEGEVEVTLPGGHTRAIGPDETFGELALIGDRPRSGTAVAVKDSKLAVINEKTFLWLVHESPTFALQVMSSIADRLQAND